MVGSVQLPRSSARLCFLEEEAAELQAVSWVSHWATPPAREPELAALAQELCWIAQERWIAAPAFRKVAPLTENGRSEAVEVTGGGAPPRVPLNVWILLLVADGVKTVVDGEVESQPDAGEVASAEELATLFEETVPLLRPELVEATTKLVLIAWGAVDFVLADPEEAGLAAGVTPATAAFISPAVVSSTSRFWEKIHPGSSSAVSHVFPLPVASFTSPGANVPDLSAC